VGHTGGRGAGQAQEQDCPRAAQEAAGFSPQRWSSSGSRSSNIARAGSASLFALRCLALGHIVHVRSNGGLHRRNAQGRPPQQKRKPRHGAHRKAMESARAKHDCARGAGAARLHSQTNLQRRTRTLLRAGSAKARPPRGESSSCPSIGHRRARRAPSISPDVRRARRELPCVPSKGCGRRPQ
jgi:hypothetical protein